MSISGKWIAFKLGGMVPVLVPGMQSFDAEISSEPLDGMTAEDEGYTNDDDGAKSVVITARLVIDITTGSYAAITTGTLLTDAKFYLDIAADPVLHLPVAKVFRATFRGEVKGRVTYDCVIHNKGPFTEDEPN